MENKAEVFPLQSIGYDACPINTVQFSNHIGSRVSRGFVRKYTLRKIQLVTNTTGEPEEGDDPEFWYQRTETFEKYRRPDVTIFTKRTEGVQKIAKPKQQAPVPVPIEYKTVPVY